MLFDQPGDGLGLRLRKAEARPELARHPCACDGMILFAALGDVVQEQRHIEHHAIAERGQNLAAQRMILLQPPRLDIREDADAAQQMLVHRIVVIHVELHQGHDAPEIGNELAEHARLVHLPQHGFGRPARGQDLDEHAVGFGVLAQLAVEALQRHGDKARGVGVDRQAVAVRDPVEANDVDRILLEDILARHGDAIHLHRKIAAGQRVILGPQTTHETIKNRPWLGLFLLQRGAKNGGEIAHILRHQEVMLHEAFDVAEARMGGVAKACGDGALLVEGEPVLGALGDEMQVATHAPQEFLAAMENLHLALGEDAGLHEFVGLAHPVHIFGDPEERVDVAQAALALLDVGFDEIARQASAVEAGVAFLQFRGDEFAGGLAHQLRIEAGAHVFEERLVAENETGFQQRGAHGHVLARLAQAFIDRAGRMAHLLPEVPEHVEHGFDDAFAPWRLLVGQQEQEVDVGARRQGAAPVAAHRRNSQSLGG